MAEYKQETIIIDRENMVFLARTESEAHAHLLVDCEFTHTHTVVLPLEVRSKFGMFGVLELMLLYKNTKGEVKPDGIHNYGPLIVDCYNLALAVPINQRTLFDLQKASASLGAPVYPAVIPKVPVISRLDPSAVANYTPHVAIPKAPVDRIPGTKPSKGATGRVWEVADKVRAEMGGCSVSKEMRTKIIAACEAIGINAGTAATQFGKWKATQD